MLPIKKRGSVLPYIIILFLAVIAGNWLYGKYSTLPSKLTQETAASIYKYPNSELWTIQNKKGLCTFSAKNCSLASKIIFTSQDDWQTVYRYHVNSMKITGWKTNSTVYTSIPTGVIFNSENGCEAELTPKRKGLFEFNDAKSGQYFFNVTCPA